VTHLASGRLRLSDKRGVLAKAWQSGENPVYRILFIAWETTQKNKTSAYISSCQ
jgi:hypothetical protein